MKYQVLIDRDLADEESINILLQSRDGRERLEAWLQYIADPVPTAKLDVVRVDTQTKHTTHKPLNPDEYARELQIRAGIVIAGFVGLFIILRMFS